MLAELFQELDARITRFDLLCHPFYQAWEAGLLTRDDLRAYACEYYHHVAAFPTYLSALHARLDDGPSRRAVLRNLVGEELAGRAHSELWLDFAEALGAGRDQARRSTPVAEVAALIASFRQLAREAPPVQAVAAFYAYESQVPRIAAVKAQGLRDRYGVSAAGRAYFTLHATADVEHAAAWKVEMERMLAAEPASADSVLQAAEAAAAQLWRALDGIERGRCLRNASTAGSSPTIQ